MRMRCKMVIGIASAVLVAAMLGGAKLRAQSTASNGFDTPESAASSFVEMLELLKKAPSPLAGHREPLAQYISLKDIRLLGQHGATQLSGELFKSSLTPRVRATIQERSGNSAVVSVVPETQDETYKPVVCIEENGRWRIDLIATYARWNDMDEKAVLSQLMPRLIRGRENARRASCQTNLKQVALATLMYAQDYDEKYPPARKWNDAIQPYAESEQIYHCPSVTGSKYGYAMNWRFSGKSLATVKSPAETITHYDSKTLKRNAVGGGGKDIAFRHLDGANYAFADGHIKWMPASQIPSFLLNLPRAQTKNIPHRTPSR